MKLLPVFLYHDRESGLSAAKQELYTMNYFPLFISLKGHKILIAGGGHMALHKVRMLKPFGPNLQVIAPQICDALREEQGVEFCQRRVKPSDLEGCLLVVAATDEPAVNHTLAKLAQEKGIFCNCVDDPDWCSFLFPALVEDGPLSIGICTSGCSPTAAGWLKEEIHRVLPDGFGDLLAWLGEIRPVVKKQIPLQKQRAELFHSLFYESVQSGGKLDESRFLSLLEEYARKEPKEESSSPLHQPGEVVLAGAGCGSQLLLTEEVRQLLQQAPVVVYDDLVDETVLALTRQAKKLYVGKRNGRHSWSQDQINALLADLSGEYPLVLRLKGGDPFVFGRGMEEMLYLRKKGIFCRECSGMPSFVQVPSRFEIPLTHRGLSDQFLVVTGTSAFSEEDRERWHALASYPGTLVVLMGFHRLETIVSSLLEGGMDPWKPAAVLSSANIRESQAAMAPVCRLVQETKKKDLQSPALLVFSDTVALSPWYPGNAQTDRSVQVCTACSERLRTRLQACLPAWLPVRSVVAVDYTDHPDSVQEALEWIQSHQGGLFFSSPHGAELFLSGLDRAGLDGRALAGQQLFAVGEATAQVLRQHGLRADATADPMSLAGLARAGLSVLSRGTPVLSLRAEGSSPQLEQTLAEEYPVTRLDLYSLEYSALPWPDAASENSLHIVVCGSLQETEALCRLHPDLPKNIRAVCVSQACADLLAEKDIPAVVSATPMADDLAECIRNLADQVSVSALS